MSAALSSAAAGAAWFKLNAGHSSFYYAQYDSAAWRALALAVAGGGYAFDVEDRVGVLTNAVALFAIGEMRLADVRARARVPPRARSGPARARART